MATTNLFLYNLHLADTAVILAQRNAEWTGHGPVLEQDIAITNISLDLLGQARNFYQYAADLYNAFSEKEKSAVDSYLPLAWKTFGRELQEDDLAFLREEKQFLNVLLAELPKGDWANTILRQFFISNYQYLLYQSLSNSQDARLAGIAEKSLKEVAYHLRWSGEWVIRLGDGTAESRQRIEKSLEELWMFTGELFLPAGFELSLVQAGLIVSPETLKENWTHKLQTVFTEAGLAVPNEGWWQQGGKKGIHTEHLGYLLAEMQYLQRAHPNAIW